VCAEYGYDPRLGTEVKYPFYFTPILTKIPIGTRIGYQGIAAGIEYREAKLWLF